MALVLVFVFLGYFILVVILIIGWNKSERESLRRTSDKENMLSVIVPVRNEEKTIAFLLDDLMNQNYQAFEVVIINDHSDDQTNDVVLNHIRLDNRFKLLNSIQSGKKAALTTGIDASKGSVVVTTDADCRVGINWLRTLNRHFQDDDVKFAFGGVKIMENDFFFSSLQAMEFSSLVGSGVATLAFGFPTMCNGANLGFRKEVFYEVGGYADNLHLPSGDDEFLLRKIFTKFPKGVRFMNDAAATVCTSAQSSIKDFISQRIRWAGKWRYHKALFSRFLTLYILVFQLSSISLLLMGSMGLIDMAQVALLLLIKILLEFIFLQRVSAFLANQWSWPSFILLQLFYPFYVLFIGAIANFKSFEWKGRKLKSIRVKSAHE